MIFFYFWIPINIIWNEHPIHWSKIQVYGKHAMRRRQIEPKHLKWYLLGPNHSIECMPSISAHNTRGACEQLLHTLLFSSIYIGQFLALNNSAKQTVVIRFCSYCCWYIRQVYIYRSYTFCTISLSFGEFHS